MTFKFEKLRVWEDAMLLCDLVHHHAKKLPEEERFSLSSQWRRATDSVALNISEGSTAQSDAEQVKFLKYARRSLDESVTCMHLARRRKYIQEKDFHEVYEQSTLLAKRLSAFMKSLK